MKEHPLHKYAREHHLYMILGTMASESVRRQSSYLKTGCNAYLKRDPTSQPMSFWTEQDVLAYLKMTGLSYASVYGEIFEEAGKLTTTGVKRSGCMFCMFGAHLEKEPNRFQRMEVTHPKQYDFCIHKLGCGDVLDYLHIPYTTKERTRSMENEKDYQPDILNFLEKIVQRNTLAYKEDFDVDKEILWNSAQESSLEHRSFLWMSRPCGTWCVPERETYLQDSRAYKTWTFYADQPNGIKAYRVVVDGVRDGKLAGKVIHLDYAKQVQRVVKSALPIAKVQYRDKDEYFAKAAMKHSFTAYCGWRKTHTIFDMYRNVKRNCSAFYRWSTRWKSRISALDGQNLLPCSGNGISTACGADLASMSFVKRPLLGANP